MNYWLLPKNSRSKICFNATTNNRQDLQQLVASSTDEDGASRVASSKACQFQHVVAEELKKQNML